MGDETRQWFLNELFQAYPSYSTRQQLDLMGMVRFKVWSDLGLTNNFSDDDPTL